MHASHVYLFLYVHAYVHALIPSYIGVAVATVFCLLKSAAVVNSGGWVFDVPPTGILDSSELNTSANTIVILTNPVCLTPIMELMLMLMHSVCLSHLSCLHAHLYRMSSQ